MPVAAWTFMLIVTAAPPYMHAEYMGPYPTREVCEAAIQGARKFETDYQAAPYKQYSDGQYAVLHRFQECTDDPFVIEAQWLEEIDNQRYGEGEYGGPH
jgi:hypothetical protein